MRTILSFLSRIRNMNLAYLLIMRSFRKKKPVTCGEGNTALNQLGLSTQVPADWTYISSGPYKEYTFGNVTLTFSHRSDSQMIGMSFGK